MSENKIKAKVATLIFMDLETTGLPSTVGKKNVHITEMSFVAVDRNSFETDQNLRVLNKLSLCIRPRCVVSHDAMDITGLYNDILEPQKEFDDSIPKLLEYFFRRLQGPMCLLAHNGIMFDFPVLQAELKRIKYALDPHILCADTIQAFRFIFSFEKQIKDHPKEESVAKENFVGDEIDALLSQDMESFVSLDRELEIIDCKPDRQMVNSSLTEHIKIHQQQTELLEKSEFLDPKENEKTPTNCKLVNERNAQLMQKRKRKNMDHNCSTIGASSAKRALFPEPQSIRKFSLESLYIHFFREPPPQSHCAEIDCISLSKVCQRESNKFLDWVDSHSEAFSNIKAMW